MKEHRHPPWSVHWLFIQITASAHVRQQPVVARPDHRDQGRQGIGISRDHSMYGGWILGSGYHHPGYTLEQIAANQEKLAIVTNQKIIIHFSQPETPSDINPGFNTMPTYNWTKWFPFQPGAGIHRKPGIDCGKR